MSILKTLMKIMNNVSNHTPDFHNLWIGAHSHINENNVATFIVQTKTQFANSSDGKPGVFYR